MSELLADVTTAAIAHVDVGGSVMLKALQLQIRQLYSERGYNAGPQTLVLGVVEELGELAQAILLTECEDFEPSAKKLSPAYADARDPAREVGDCITYLLALCNKLGVEPYFKWMKEGDE